MTLKTIRNPDLAPDPAAVDDTLPNWNLPANRRWGFHNLHRVARYGLTIRAPAVLPLIRDIDRRIGDLPDVRRLTGSTMFSAMVVVRRQTILFERYAADFGPDRPHSIQSISKTPMNLVFGRLVDEGLVDLARPAGHYLPDVGSGYAGATVQQVLDMDVMNNFNEDYEDPYRSNPGDGATVGYNNEEIAMGWRLPPPGEAEPDVRAFAASLVSDDVRNPVGDMQYRSPNTDILAWIAERVGGRPLRHMLIEVIEAAGIAGAYHMATDRLGTPVIAGGASMTARDLARYGLLFARGGVGVEGQAVGRARFIDETRNGRGTLANGWGAAGRGESVRYSNHMFTNGRWLGHAGFGGQFMMVDPDSETVVVFFSVLENRHAHDDDYFPEIIAMADEVIRASY